jgi:hypothetical protein
VVGRSEERAQGGGVRIPKGLFAALLFLLDGAAAAVPPSTLHSHAALHGSLYQQSPPSPHFLAFAACSSPSLSPKHKLRLMLCVAHHPACLKKQVSWLTMSYGINFAAKEIL